MTLWNVRYEEIKKLAVDICEKYDVRSVPINVFELALKLGIKVIPYPAKKHDIFIKESDDGFFMYVDEEPRIYYNPEKMYGRINYTILHEVGHILLGHIQESNLAETEANFFAKYLLAPPPLIQELQLISAEGIINAFGMSYEASCNAWNYYTKWLRKTKGIYNPYEQKMVKLFRSSLDEYSRKYPLGLMCWQTIE
ncbi:MAG: ImmA/IrrE family metallo-endopeptidase [Alphaproteobacteria bacterium]|nr:ImmA/IrrE family metallo-endopeptidase [Alphaproteobacteria bacterium]